MRVEDLRLLLWLWRELYELGLPVRMMLGSVLMVVAKVALKALKKIPGNKQRQVVRVGVDWVLFAAGVLFAGPTWVVANLVHNCLYYNDFESVWSWLLILPVVAHAEGLMLYMLPRPTPVRTTVWSKIGQIMDLVWRMRQ